MQISDRAVIVHPDRLKLGVGVTIDHFAVVGQINPYPGVFEHDGEKNVVIGDHAVIGCYAMLFEGATVAANAVVEARGTVGSLSAIGAASRLLYGAQVHDNVSVGADSFIAGFIADNCHIGDRCRVFGSLIHKFGKPQERDWDTTDEVGPVLGNDVIVGWNAILIGPIRIGNGVRIKPGSIVRRDLADHERYG